MNDETPTLDFVKADGGREKASASHVLAVKAVINAHRTDIADAVQTARTTALDQRLCRWEGQSPDGRKRDSVLNHPAMPFDGASDTRPFTSDGVINYIVAELKTAALRATPRDMGMEGTDGKNGGYNSTLIKWLVKNQWSTDFPRQVELLAQYTYGDSPAGAVLWCDWEEEKEVVMQTITWDELIAQIVEVMPEEPSPEEGDILIDLVTNPERAIELRQVLSARFEQLKPARINKMVTGLYAKGEVEFPMPRVKSALPRIAALRQFEDVFYPRYVTDLQRSPWIIRRNLLTAAQVREDAAKHGWSQKFVKALLDVGRGKTAFSDEAADSLAISEAVDGSLDAAADELYEILTVLARAVNDDGIAGIYWQTCSYFVDLPATDRHLFDRSHGKYPCIHFSREALTSALADGRGVSELLSTIQNSIKLLDDSFEDHTQIATNPVRKIPSGAPAGTYRFTPCGEVEVGPREGNSLGYIDPPKYPTSNKDHYQRKRRQIGEYFGIPFEDTNEAFVLLFSQSRVDNFLGGLAEMFMMCLQLIHEKMDPQQIAEITARSVESIEPFDRAKVQGRYNISLTFDVRDLNMDYLTKKAEVAFKYLRAMDDNKRIDGSAIAVRILESIDPNWADESVRSQETANAAESEDEKKNLSLMLNGIRPLRPDDNRAQNFPIRLQALEQELQLRQQNPEAFPPITPAAAAIIQEQLEYVGFQTQQRDNAQTGRLGFKETNLSEIGNLKPETGGLA